MSKPLSKLIPDLKKKVKNLNCLIEYGHYNEDGSADSNIALATKALYMDKGTVYPTGEVRIPARPFHEYSILYVHDNFKKDLSNVLSNLIHGDQEQAKVDIGNYLVSVVQDTIENETYAPLADETVRKKGHDLPLLDTYELFDKVNFKIK